MLVLTRKLNEKITIGDDIVITVIDIKNDAVRIGIEAPRNVKVHRAEVLDAVSDENRKAAGETDTAALVDLIQASGGQLVVNLPVPDRGSSGE